MQLSHKLESKASDIVRGSNYGYFEVMLYEIVRWAAWYWTGLNEDDFGLQSFSGDVIVFGGFNRLVWRPQHGYIADRDYCSPRFLANYDSIGPLPGRSEPR